MSKKHNNILLEIMKLHKQFLSLIALGLLFLEAAILQKQQLWDDFRREEQKGIW